MSHPPEVKPPEKKPSFQTLLGDDANTEIRGGEHWVRELTLPDYLQESLNVICPEDPEFQRRILYLILVQWFLGVLGSDLFYSRYAFIRMTTEDGEKIPKIFELLQPENLASSLEYWARYPQTGKVFWGEVSLHKSYCLSLENHGELLDIDLATEDEDSAYSDSADHDDAGEDNSSSMASEDELIEDDTSSDDDDDDFKKDKIAYEKFKDMEGFLKRVIWYCDRTLAESLTGEHRQTIEEKFGKGLGNIDQILGAHPTKTGAKTFDTMFPIPEDPKDCFDVYEVIPDIEESFLIYHGRRGVGFPSFTLETLCLLAKATSAVAYNLFTELKKEVEQDKEKGEDEDDDKKRKASEISTEKDEEEDKKRQWWYRGTD